MGLAFSVKQDTILKHTCPLRDQIQGREILTDKTPQFHRITLNADGRLAFQFDRKESAHGLLAHHRTRVTRLLCCSALIESQPYSSGF